MLHLFIASLHGISTRPTYLAFFLFISLSYSQALQRLHSRDLDFILNNLQHHLQTDVSGFKHLKMMTVWTHGSDKLLVG